MLLIEFILHRRMVGRMAVIEEGRVVVIHSDDTTGPLHIERRAAQSPRTLELELSSSSRSKGCSPFPNFTTGTWQFYQSTGDGNLRRGFAATSVGSYWVLQPAPPVPVHFTLNQLLTTAKITKKNVQS